VDDVVKIGRVVGGALRTVTAAASSMVGCLDRLRHCLLKRRGTTDEAAKALAYCCAGLS
jgi:hypothetical protein